MLRMLDKYKDAAVVRTRDPELWNKATVLVDVGEKYSVNGEM